MGERELSRPALIPLGLSLAGFQRSIWLRGLGLACLSWSLRKGDGLGAGLVLDLFAQRVSAPLSQCWGVGEPLGAVHQEKQRQSVLNPLGGRLLGCVG